MSGNNMESLLMGGDDSSSGESDDEVNVNVPAGGTAASAVAVMPAPASAPPPAPTPAPDSSSNGAMSQMARLKSLYNSQPKRPTPTPNSGASTPTASNASHPAPAMQPPPMQITRPGISQPPAPHQMMHQRPSQPSQQQPPPQQQQQQQQMMMQQQQQSVQQHQQQQRHPTSNQGYPSHPSQPSTSHHPGPSSQSQTNSSSGMPDPFAPTPLHRIKERHQQKIVAQQRAQQMQMQPPPQHQHQHQHQHQPPPQHQQQHQQQPPRMQQPPPQQQPPQQLHQQHPPSRMPTNPTGTTSVSAAPGYHRPQQPPQQQQQQPPQQQQQQLVRPSTQDRAAMERELRKQKEKFLMFTRVLIKYLEQKDANLHHQAKLIIKDCADRNKRQEKGYESVTAAMKDRLKKLVGEQYWKRAEAYLKHFLEQKKTSLAAPGTSAGTSRPPGASVPVPGLPPPNSSAPPPQVSTQQRQQQQQQQQAQLEQEKRRKMEQEKAAKFQQQQQQQQQQSTSTSTSATTQPPAGAPTLQQMQREIASQKAKIASASGTGVSVGKKQVKRKSSNSASGARKSVGNSAGVSSPHAQAAPQTAVAAAVDQPANDALPPREYNELMKLVDHAIDYDWTTAGLLLGSKTDLQLTDEQRHMLYGDTDGAARQQSVRPSSATTQGPRPGWGYRNIVSARTAWAAVRLREHKATQSSQPVVGDIGLTLPGTASGDTTASSSSNENTRASTAWVNEETAEQDVALAMLSEATEIYLKGIMEKAICCARQRYNVDGIRLWHQQHIPNGGATPAATNGNSNGKSKPALALRLGCDVSRQEAQAFGNAAMTVRRMEQALERQSGVPSRARVLQGETLEEATSMSDLALRPQLAKGAETAEMHAKRNFEEYGGKHAMEPPLGRVPKQAKLEVVDFQMGSKLMENVGRHWACNAAASVYF